MRWMSRKRNVTCANSLDSGGEIQGAATACAVQCAGSGSSPDRALVLSAQQSNIPRSALTRTLLVETSGSLQLSFWSLYFWPRCRELLGKVRHAKVLSISQAVVQNMPEVALPSVLPDLVVIFSLTLNVLR